MVYVFGVNLPLMEILLAEMVLLLAGLAFVLVELKKLRQLLVEEKGVVRQFEDDLARFEKDEGKVHNNQLEAYVKSALGRGLPKDKIEATLVGRGWDKASVEKILQSVH